MASVTVYAVKQGNKWLTKVQNRNGGSYTLRYCPLSDSRYLNGVEAQARQMASECGGVVVPVVFTAQ